MKRLITCLVFAACLAYAQQPVNLALVAGGTALTGNGVSSGALRVTLSNDSTGQVALASGTTTIVTQTTASNLNAAVVGVGTAGSPSGGVLSIQGVSGGTAVPVSGTFTFGPASGSTSATSAYHASSAAAANVKASAGNLYGLVLGNGGTVPCWLQLFNSAGTPTAGTSVVDSYMVQAGLTVVIPVGAIALKNYATGIAAAGATTDSGATTTGCTTTFSVSAYYD
jgi:hypothetical protein